MANYFSEGNDRQYIPPGPAGTVLTSNGPGRNPSWLYGVGEATLAQGNYVVNPATDETIVALGPNKQIITLPVTGLTSGQEFTIIAGGAGYPITVQPLSGNINGSPSYTLTNRYYAVTVIWTGTQYLIESVYSPSAETIVLTEFNPVYPVYFAQPHSRCLRSYMHAVYAAGSASPWIDLALAP